MFEIALLLMLAFILLMAIITVESRDLLSAVVALGAVGFGLAVVFLLLRAPEVVTAQIVVEIITFITLILTVYKTSKSDTTPQVAMRNMSPQILAIVFFSILFIMFVLPGLRALPEFGSPVMNVSGSYINRVTREIGANNIVTAVLLDFRAYNTLIEAFVILTMVVGVFIVMRPKGRKDGPNS